MFADFFDPNGNILVHEHFRPHWSQRGAVVFITFRTHDSIPREIAEQWEREKRQWLLQRGVNPPRDLRTAVQMLSEKDQREYRTSFRRAREICLDASYGRCLLKRADLAGIVADALLHFYGKRYQMGDFVVMPNHVHLLAAFPDESSMQTQCDSWLHYTAFRINRAIGEKGKFWQQEPFDHIVRSVRQYEYLRNYIADNPVKARLNAGEYYHRRRSD